MTAGRVPETFSPAATGIAIVAAQFTGSQLIF
jgi:hypothetical protein